MDHRVAREKKRIQNNRIEKDLNTAEVEANGPTGDCSAGRQTLNPSQEAIQVEIILMI